MPVTIDVPGLGPVEIPDNVPDNLAAQYVSNIAKQRGISLPEPEPVKKPYGIGTAARDIAVSAAGIVPGLIETAAEFTPIDRAARSVGAESGIAGLVNNISPEYAKSLNKYGLLRGTAKELRDLQREMFSEQAQAAQKEFQEKLAKENTFLGEAGTAIKETLTTPELLASNLPESITSMIGGRGIAKGAEKILRSAAPELTEKAGEAVSKTIGKKGMEYLGGPETLKTIAGGAAMQGASVSNQNFNSVMDMPQEKLAATPEYQKAIAAGLNPEDARRNVAQSAANGALLPATAISVVSQTLPYGASVERLLAGATIKTLGKSGAFKFAKEVGKSGLGEFTSEAIEEGGGQLAGNVFMPGQEDIMQGVGTAAGMAGAMGLIMGGGAGGVNALQAGRAQKVIEQRQAEEERERQELDARMPPVEQIQHPEPVQLAPEQISNAAQSFSSSLQPNSTFTLDDIVNTAGISGGDAAAVANNLLNRGEIVQQPGDTLGFRRVSDEERLIPLGNPDQSYIYTVPTTRENAEINDGYTVESQALGVTRNVANQEEADQLKQLMLDRAGEQAALVDEQINYLREREAAVTRILDEAKLRPGITEDQLQGLTASRTEAAESIRQEIAKLEEQKAAMLAEPVVIPINPRAEAGFQVRLYTPGEPARVLSDFSNAEESLDAIIDNAPLEQQKSIVEEPEYENVRKRLEERASELEEEPEEQPVEMTPEMQQRAAEVGNRMRSVLDQMGLQNIGLNVQQRLQEAVNGKLKDVDGYYLNRVISASLEGSRDVTATIGHETIHALRELGMFSDKEWQILTRKAKSEWIKKYEIEKRYENANISDEKVIEEAVADAFGDWFQGNLEERGVIQGLFNRIKLFFQKFGSVLRGQGFVTSEDVFKRARTGTLEGDRVARPSEGRQFAQRKPEHTHVVVDPRNNNKVMGYYKGLSNALRGRDRLDNAYGAYRYRVEKIKPEGQQYALPRTVNVDGKERPTHIIDINQLRVMQNEDFNTYSVYDKSANRVVGKFETAEEAKDYLNKLSRPIHPTVEGVENFWRWFGNSKIVNKQGGPKIMYHGTAADISEFRKKQANAIFVTEDPIFAETFANSSISWMIANAEKILSPEQLKIAVKKGLEDAASDGAILRKNIPKYENDKFRDLITQNYASDYVRKAVEESLPSNENIIPLFVRAEKTFDYDSEDDRNALMAWAKSLDKINPARRFIEDKKYDIENGEWVVIESPAVQDFIKSNGYDSFYMYEGGFKNLAVFDPNQLKSAVGNTGAFSRDSGEIQYALPLTSTERDEIVRRAKKDLNLAQQMLRFAKNMTPQEREKLSRANAVKMIDLLGQFPDVNEYAAVAFAGRAKRGWYKQSAETLVSVFGSDAPRFAALLAALSPQCSVETNLTNALNLWKNWTAAGRPTSRAAIIKIAGESVQGDKGEESVLDAWKNNSERALTIENVNDLVLSGPKVNSFFQNLIGVTYEVTNDAWMANFAFLDQKLFSGSLIGKYDPGKRPGYLTQSIIVREAADILTKKTGREWTPAEVQETVWSWAKALYEGAEAEGIAPIQFLTEGKLTDELINAVPDFGTLFYSPEYESILREAGYGKQLDELIQQRDRTGEELPDEKRVAEEEAEPFGPITQGKLVASAAKRLGELKAFRDRQAQIEKRLKGESVVVFEIRPSESLTNLVPEIHDADPKMKKKFADGARDILFNDRGEDRIALLLGHISKLRKIGSGGFEGRVHPNYQVTVPEEDANAYSAAVGYVFLQDAVPWQKPKFDGWGFGIAISAKETKGGLKSNMDTIESDFFNALEKLTGTGHTRDGRTLYVGNFSDELDNETFEYLVLQIAKEVGIKHKVELEAEGYKFDGNYLTNSIEDENGATINAWKTKAGGAGYLQGDGGARLANLQNSLDAMQSEFVRYCEDFRETYLTQKQKVGKGKKREDAQFALPRNILGQRATLPTWTSPTDSKVDNVIYSLQDKMIDLKRVVQEIIKSAGNIADRWNPYLQEELYHGRTAQQTERFLRAELRPLLIDLNKSNITISELEEYLHNRHAKERNDQIASVNPSLPDEGSGIKTKNAINYLNAIPAARKRTLDALAKKVDDINRGTRKILVDSGLEKAETIASWEETYPNYVPLFREDADYVTSSGYGIGQGFNIRGDFSKRATGSTRNVIDIMANVVMQRERAIIRAEKNRVAKALYGLAVQNPNQKFWMPIDPEAIKDPSKIRNEILAMGINPNDIQNIFQQPTQPKVDPRTGLVTNKLDPFVLNSDNVMAVRIDGRNHYLLFNDNEPRSKRMVTALKNLDADQLGRVMNFMGKISRWVSNFNTQYNPIFGVVNLFRDVQGAALNLSTTPIAGKAKEVMNLNNLKDAMGAIWSVSRAERKDGKIPNTPWAKLWIEFQEEGGQTGYRSQYSSAQERADALQSELNKISEGKLKHAGRAMVDVLTDYNTTMENAVRLSAYKTALDKGLSKQQAASIAKNLTVNFNRKGQIATQAGALYSFFNASVQGSARLAETLAGPMKYKIIAGGLLLGAVQAALLAAAGFDDDEPPEFIKERNLVIPIGGKKYISIPMPLGYNVIPNFSRHLAEIGISGGKHIGDHIAGITGSFIESFNPIGGSGWSLQTLTPTAIDPLAALAENKDSFGRPIYKENFSSLDPTPGYMRTKDSATAFSKTLSEFLNAASGGTKYKPGVVDVTPDQIDYLLGQVGGGVFRELQKTEQTITNTIKGEEVAPYKMPLVGRFYGNAESNAAQAQRYYENILRLNKHENEINGRIKNHEPIAEYFQENPEARLFKIGNGIEYNIRKLKQRKKLLESNDANKEQIKLVDDAIVKLMIRLNERMDRVQD